MKLKDLESVKKEDWIDWAEDVESFLGQGFGFYTSREVKNLFGISSSTLGRWRKKGVIPYAEGSNVKTSQKFLYPAWVIDKIFLKRISNKEQTE